MTRMPFGRIISDSFRASGTICVIRVICGTLFKVRIDLFQSDFNPDAPNGTGGSNGYHRRTDCDPCPRIAKPRSACRQCDPRVRNPMSGYPRYYGGYRPSSSNNRI